MKKLKISFNSLQKPKHLVIPGKLALSISEGIRNLYKSTPFLAVSFLLLLTIVFFSPFFFKGFIPIPGDIILDASSPPYPYKHFEMNDAVSFYYPMKLEIVRQIKDFQLPVWNSFILNGTPLLGDGHSGTVYPLNLLLFLGSFNFGWSLFIIIQPFLGALFLYSFLRHHNLTTPSAILGAISFGFGSYFINQVELANVMHTALWLPLVLLAIDKVFEKNKYGILLLSISLTFMFLAGFLQFFLYGCLLALGYFFFKRQISLKIVGTGMVVLTIFLLLSAVQLLPFLDFLPDTVRWRGEGVSESVTEFLVRPRQLITMISPDFFGNPATGNWTGDHNYYEFVAYIGPFLLPLLFFALRSSHKVFKFFLGVFVLSLVLAVTNPVSEFIYGSGIPLLSTMTPSRMLIIFALTASVLVALGAEEIARTSRKGMSKLLLGYLAFLIALYFGSYNKHLILPLLFTVSAFGATLLLKKTRQIIWVLILLTSVSLFYQAKKYLPFVSPELIYPETGTTQFLKENLGNYRMLSIHTETIPVNGNMVYGLPTSSGYHPIHDYSYHLLTSELQFQNKTARFGKSIFLTGVNSPVIELTRAKYIVNLGEITNPEVLPLLKEAHREGETFIYEVATPAGEIESGYPPLYYRQQKWGYIGLVITSIGITLLLVIPGLTRNLYK